LSQDLTLEKGSAARAREHIKKAVAHFGVTLQANWGSGRGERALNTAAKHKVGTQEVVSKLLLHGLPHQIKEAKKAAKDDTTASVHQLAMIATDGKSLHLVMERPLKPGEKKKKASGDDDDDGDGKKAKVQEDEEPAETHRGIVWSGLKPPGKTVASQTILFCDDGVKEKTVTRAPDAHRDAVEQWAKKEPIDGLAELLQRDSDARVRGNRQMCKGNWDSVARQKRARADEKRALDRLNAVLATAGTSVEQIQSTLRDLASVTGVDAMRQAIVRRARAAPVLFFAYFHPVYRENRRQYLLATKRHTEQLVGSFLESAVALTSPEPGKDPPLWRNTRVQLPAFSEGTRARQEHRSSSVMKLPKLPKDRRVQGDLTVIKGNWAGYGHNRSMQRQAGGFPRKTLEKRVETSLREQRRQQGHNTYFGTQDEYASSVAHSKLSVGLTEQRLNKFNPTKGAIATIVKPDGTVKFFTIDKDRPHKLLAWLRRLDNGEVHLIVANRDEATCINYLLIYVCAFLGLPRPLHLSRMGTFFSLGRPTATPISSGRGLCGSESGFESNLDCK
jgi:hypothetical protein